MRILCISPFFPPYYGAEAFCGGKMVLALRNAGADVEVLSMDRPYPRTAEDSSPVWPAMTPQPVFVPMPEKRELSRSLRCSVKYRSLNWARWIDDVVQQARRLDRENPFQVVYSRSLPMFSHIAGFWTSKELGLPWIANINDPWDLHLFPYCRCKPVSLPYALFSMQWLRRTLACADVLTFPCQRLADFTSRLAGRQPRARIEIIPHVGMSASRAEDDGHFRLVHTGSIGANEITGRSALTLLLGLQRFLKKQPGAARALRLVWVGPEDPATDRFTESLGLQPIASRTGRVNFERSLAEIASASVCLLIEAKMEEGQYLPSKLADYLVARKPVLAVSPAVGVIADLTSTPGITRIDDGYETAAEKAIERYYSAYTKNNLPAFAPAESLAKRFSVEAVASQFLDLASEFASLGTERSSLYSLRCAVLSTAVQTALAAFAL